MALDARSQNMASRPDAATPRQSWWASLVLSCAVLGALLGLSVKSRDAIRRQNIPADNYPALSQQYLIVKQGADDERRTIATLQKKVSEYASGTASNTKQEKALLDDLTQTKFQAGLTAVTGPGAVVTLNDSKKAIQPIPGVQPLNLVHDTDINQVVNELKAAGAEAVSVNDQRLVAVSPIRCAGPTIFVNNTAQTPPYVIRAIGKPDTLETAVNLPGGFADQMRAIDPAMIQVKTSPKLLVPAYAGASQPKYARPVASPASAP